MNALAETAELRNDLDLPAKDARHVLHPWADLQALGSDRPVVMNSAKGVRVKDSEGTTYLDAIGGMWCMTVGYGCEELADAIGDQARQMAYYTSFGDVSTQTDGILIPTPGALAIAGLGIAGIATRRRRN